MIALHLSRSLDVSKIAMERADAGDALLELGDLLVHLIDALLNPGQCRSAVESGRYFEDSACLVD